MTQLTGSIIGICAILGLFWSSYQYVNSTYAKAAEVQQLEQRLDAKIIEDRLKAVQERLWKLTERFGENPKEPIIKEEIQKLTLEKERLDKKLETIVK